MGCGSPGEGGTCWSWGVGARRRGGQAGHGVWRPRGRKGTRWSWGVGAEGERGHAGHGVWRPGVRLSELRDCGALIFFLSKKKHTLARNSAVLYC